MKTKLTLSLPEKTIQEAKKIASARNMSVSALFSESLSLFLYQASSTNSSPEMADLVGVFEPKAPFDARSARIREKHG